MRRLLMVALVLQTAACAGAPDPAGSVQPTAGSGDGIADVLPVSCEDGVLSIGVERVRVHADGLHVQVAELPDRGTSVEIRSPDDPDLLEIGSGGAAHDTGLTVLDTVAPGTVLVRCYPDDGPRHMLSISDDDETMSVEIVDDGGHWAEPERLDCGGVVAHMIPDYGAPPAPPAEPVEPLARAVDTAGREGAEVRTYGYPAGTTRWASVAIDSRIVSRSSYVRDGTGWRVVGSTGCE